MIKIVNGLQHYMFDFLHHELRNPLTTLDFEWFGGIGINQQHFQFTAVTAIDEPWRIETGHSVFQSQAAARLDKPSVTFRNCNRKTSSDKRPPAGWKQNHVLARHEIEPGIAHSGIGRQL